MRKMVMKTRVPTLGRLLVLVSATSMLAAGCVVVDPYGGPGTVLVCHKGKKTLSLPEPAVDAHLAHGDYLGACL
jgi:hypothetical protein